MKKIELGDNIKEIITVIVFLLFVLLMVKL